MTNRTDRMPSNLQQAARRAATDSIYWTAERWRWLPPILVALAVFAWLLSLPAIDPRAMTDIGLLSVLPPGYYAALLLLAGSFVLTVYVSPQRRWLLLLHIVVLIVFIHATPTLVYGTLRYSWSWKHAGMVDYILRHQSVNPELASLKAYQNWPGFFILNALITEAAGLPDALGYAPWATLFFNLLIMLALLLLYRSFTSDARLGWLAVWFFFATSWVGQDYFSPQTFVYFLYLVLVGVLLRWFRTPRPPDFIVRGFPGRYRISGWLHKRMVRAGIAPRPAQPQQRVLLAALLVLIIGVVTFSHQLTPMILLASLALLVVFRQAWLHGLPVLAFVMAAAWIWFMATSFIGDNLRSLLSNLGDLEGNVAKNLLNLDQASPGMVLVSYMGRGLSLLVMTLALLGFFRRLRIGQLDLAPLLLMFAPFLMLAGNSYGGEILFRIYFFALPFMAFFVAALVAPAPNAAEPPAPAAAETVPSVDAAPEATLPSVSRAAAPAAANRLGRADPRPGGQPGRAPAWPLVTVLLSLVMLVGLLFAYYGKEQQYYFTPNEVAAASFLYDSAEPGALIVEGTRNYPSLFRNYEVFTYVPIAREPESNRKTILADPPGRMRDWMANSEYPAAYLLMTRSMKAEINMVGDMAPGSLEHIEQALRASPLFQIIYENPDAVIFVLKERAP